MPKNKLLQVWPTLYKKSKSGKISIWVIRVDGNKIISEAGFQGMKMQESSDVIKSGKNIGKANETTPHEQALFEAESKWKKQIDRGYSENISTAKSGKTDSDDGFFPMLAHTYAKSADKIKYPCWVQPKLDGLRATYSNGVLYSRARKPFEAIEHIQKEIKRLGLQDLKLDGELYNHDYKDKFELIVSAVKRESEITKDVQYHVYDVFMEGNFSDRMKELALRIKSTGPIKFVSTNLVQNEKELMKYYELFLEQGYEGAMVRNDKGEYEHRRSYNLQKIKTFEDAEFLVVGVKEGRGALTGHAAAFVCQMDDKHGRRTFEAKLKGETSFLKKCFEDHSLWSGKLLKVQYQGLTGKNKVPRFPVGLHFREDFDL